MVLLANQFVTFSYEKQELDSNGQLTGNSTELRIENTPVNIYQAAMDARIYPFAAEYTWAIIFDPDLEYSDGTKIGEGQYILWDRLNNGRGTIRRPRYSWGPFVVAQAYIEEPGVGA